MSTHINHYLMLAVVLDQTALRAEYADIYERLEPFFDPTLTDQVVHIDGLCCLYDGMDGRYVAIGQVLAKTDDHGAFAEPIVVPMTVTADWFALRAKIINLLPRSAIPIPRPVVISHYT